MVGQGRQGVVPSAVCMHRYSLFCIEAVISATAGAMPKEAALLLGRQTRLVGMYPDCNFLGGGTILI